MNEPSSAHSLCESTDTKAAKKTTFSTNTNYIEIIFLSYHPPTTDSEQQDLRFQPCLSLGCWDGESLFSWPGGTAITRSLWTWWCGVSTGKSYCWWFRSPKQPPFGCIKPCKNVIFTISTGDRRISEPSTEWTWHTFCLSRCAPFWWKPNNFKCLFKVVRFRSTNFREAKDSEPLLITKSPREVIIEDDLPNLTTAQTKYLFSGVHCLGPGGFKYI